MFMSEVDTRIQRPWCARIFQVITQVAVVASIVGVFWYGTSLQPPRPPAAYLSSAMVDSLRDNDLDGFVSEVQTLACVDQTDVDGITPLIVVAGTGNRAAAEYLLSRGANPNFCHVGYGTPLVRAIVAGKHEIVMALLRYGADATLSTARGDTPLVAALRCERYDIVQALIKHQVDRLPSRA
jgi:ankyrin repeat protein